MATRFAGSLTDITEAKLADALTGLPNRFLFLDVVERAIARVERKPDYGFAILVLTLDRFRVVHDSLGAAAADRLLVAVARRLQAGLRATDVGDAATSPACTLARLGGDEFNVLIDDITDAVGCGGGGRTAAAGARSAVRDRRPSALRVGADRHRREHQRLHQGRGHPPRRRPSRSTARGRIGHGAVRNLRSGDAPERAMARLTVETDLRSAIDSEHFEMHYQPIISLQDPAALPGFEALVRWRHPSARPGAARSTSSAWPRTPA